MCVCGGGRDRRKCFSERRTFTVRAVLTEMIAPPTGDRVLATKEGALFVHADLASLTRAGFGHTLIYIY